MLDPPVRDPSRRSMTLVLGGEVDILLQPDLDAALGSVRDSGAVEVIVDGGSVTCMDCTGLGFLIALQGELGDRGGSMYVTGMGPSVRRLVELTRTAALFGVDDSHLPAGVPKGVSEPA